MNIANTMNVYGFSNAVLTSPSMPQTSHFESAQSWCERLTGSFQPNEQIVSPAHKELSWGIHLLFIGAARSLAASKSSLSVRLLFTSFFTA
ncbi:hypothetical protein [Pseudomonas sp. LS-2]|uniref:hypothetical protein n=1 Tax=Pseudomonas sp. LS-2 TaxID=2315859 RepID=UPI00140459A3|nr:hypothetical protein [Pseudomonas sp. LS-2]